MRQLLLNLKMTQKLMISPLVAIVFLIVFGIASYIGLFKQKTALDDLFNNRFTCFQTAADILIDLKEVHANMTDLVGMLSQNPLNQTEPEENGTAEKRESGRQGHVADGTTVRKRSIEEARNRDIGKLKNMAIVTQKAAKSGRITKEEKNYFLYTGEQVAKYQTAINQVLDALEQNNPLGAQCIMIDEANLIFHEIDKKLYDLLTLERQLGKGQYSSTARTFKFAFTVSLIAFAAAIVLPFGMSLLMKSVILTPINKTTNIIEAVSRGDLTKRIDVSSSDEIGEMAKYFNVFADTLHGVITQVAQSSDSVSSAANMLDTASAEMAQGIDEVAERAGALATASEEMSNTASEIARNCVAAAKSSESASSSGRSGEVIIQETIAAMDGIKGSVVDSASIIKNLGVRSDQIGDIVELINGIADQTNLLALNAAIEAARAGEHGRGFAVVADEVRKLAERTGSATKEIGQTIETMQLETKNAVSSMEKGVTEVETGAAHATKSGRALKDILEHIAIVTSEINQIAVASEEETATTNEIANSIQQISAMMQQTASKVQLNAEASHQLADLSKQLKEMVGQFRL